MKQFVHNPHGTLRWLLTALLAMLLHACSGGGGGGGDGGGSTPSPSGSFSVSANALTFTGIASPTVPTPAAQMVMATVNGNVSGTLFVLIEVLSGTNVVSVSNVVLTGGNTGQATVTPAAPSTLGVGTFTSMLRVRACMNDSTCATGQLAGSPQVINVTYTVTAPAATPAPVVTIAANPGTVMSGTTATLTWSSTNATTCTASGSWSGTRMTMGMEPTTPITAASAYTLTCAGPGGTGAATANVAVAATPTVTTPTVTLTANPTSVMSGNTATLTWTSTNATSCIASGGWSGTRSTMGMETTTPITAASTYTLTCTGAGGAAAATANVAVAATPTVTLTANPASVVSGGTANLTWSSTGATNCVASGGWTGPRMTSGNEMTTPITAASTYTLSCTGSGGSAAATANVAITQAPTPQPTVTITANPTIVMAGGTTVLTWTSTNATSCTASGDWSGNRATSGNAMITAIMRASAFTLTCMGSGGTGAATVNVAFTAPRPAVTIAANPVSVASGGSTTLTWSTTDASSCTASGSWTGSKAINGNEVIASIMLASSYTLTCTGPGGMGAATASVAITAPPALRPTVTLTANPTAVASGAATTLMWTSTNATACMASGAWTGTRGTSGTQLQATITAPAAYTLSCSGAGGMGSATANVTIATTPVMGSYQTDFGLTENPISESGVWRRAANSFTNVSTANGTAFGTNGVANTFDDSYALLRGFGTNQTAEAVIQRSPNLNINVTHEVELLLRFSDDATKARGYECLFSFDGGVQIFRWDDLTMGMFADISRSTGAPRIPLKTGDMIKASIVGNAISVFINGTLVATATDSGFTTGQPGIGFFTRPGGSSANLAITSYKVMSN